MDSSSSLRGFRTVIEKNTFYFFDREYEESYIAQVQAMADILLNIKEEFRGREPNEGVVASMLSENESTLDALLCITGISQEFLLRLVTLVRVTTDQELIQLTKRAEWAVSDTRIDLPEWSMKRVRSMLKSDDAFREGIVRLFLRGSTNRFLLHTLPPSELRKLSIRKFRFDLPDILDTLAQYKLKGASKATAGNNAETLIVSKLEALGIRWDKGDLPLLSKNVPDNKRTLDFIIPNIGNPEIVIECSYLVTTSSGQGDKAKTELSVRKLLEKYYPSAKFWGFVDGIGWYVRKGDLARMVNAYHDVFTFHSSEIDRFESELRKELPSWD